MRILGFSVKIATATSSNEFTATVLLTNKKGELITPGVEGGASYTEMVSHFHNIFSFSRCPQ